MATEQKDFKVKKGIIVGANISHTSGGFLYDSTSNTLSVGGSQVGLKSLFGYVNAGFYREYHAFFNWDGPQPIIVYI